MPDQNPTVYSTEWGRVCPKCGKPLDRCICKQTVMPTGDGIVRLQKQSKGRNGKPVTLIRGVLLQEDALQLLLKDLKKLCGCGGTLKDGVLEIQGDHREKIQAELQKRGFKVKLAGG